jgi:hypothetical protein
VTALHPRVWAEGDRVARVDRSATPWRWRLGTVCGLDGPHWLIVRWNDETPLESYVSCVGADDRNLIREDDIPVDERHWLPQKVRDQLVRQEAAEAFAKVHDVLDEDSWPETRHYLDGLVLALADGVGPDLAVIARALLTPAPTPAHTP